MNMNVSRARTEGGLLWYPGDSDSDSLNPALNAAMLLTRYAQIATTQVKANSYLVRPPTSFHFRFHFSPITWPTSFHDTEH